MFLLWKSISLAIVFVFASGMACAGPPEMDRPVPPIPPTLQAPVTPAARRIIMIGLGSSKTASIKGAVVFRTATPPTAGVKSVTFQLNDKALGSSNTSPFRLDWDSTSVEDGNYVIKAIGMDEGGQQVWSGESQVAIANKSMPFPIASKPGTVVVPTPKPLPPTPATFKPTATAPKPVPTKPAAIAPKPVPVRPATLPPATTKPTTGKPPTIVVPKPTAPAPAINFNHIDYGKPDEWKTYKSDRYGFSIDYPGTAVVRDESASMRPKRSGSFWIIFAMKNAGKPEYALNVRHQKMTEPGAPDKFAKYNPYLLNWERTTVNGMSGFKTTSGSVGAKRVIHRTLLVDGISVWMFNCTDVTGKNPDISKNILERALKGFRPAGIAPMLPEIPTLPNPAPPAPNYAPRPPLSPAAPEPGMSDNNSEPGIQEEAPEEQPAPE
ncbi:MAG: Ig-like domain-containing protein [Armatimonadota bacterium]|nr:Ig-like domain-containing protein [Armatimonadota bacterium]